MLNDKVIPTGSLKITKTTKDGTVSVYEHKNLVVTTGLEFIAARMIDNGIPLEMSHMGLGEGTTAPVLSDTSLETAAGSRVPIVTTSSTGTSVTYEALFGPDDGNGTISEGGIFNALTGGLMLCRSTFTPFTKNQGDAIVVQWTITLAASS